MRPKDSDRYARSRVRFEHAALLRRVARRLSPRPLVRVVRRSVARRPAARHRDGDQDSCCCGQTIARRVLDGVLRPVPCVRSLHVARPASSKRTHAPAVRAEAERRSAPLRRHARWEQELVTERSAWLRRAPELVTPDDVAIATIGSELPQPEVRRLFASVFAASNDSDALNALVYVALAADAKDEALDGAYKMIRLRRDARHLDTFAECHHVRGERARALLLEDEALRMARSSLLEE